MANRLRASSRSAVVAVGTAILLSGLVGSASALAAPAHVSVGYYLNSDVYDANYWPKDIPTDDYTHINYAFGNATAGGKCALTDRAADYVQPVSAANAVNGRADGANQKLRGNFNQLKELKAVHPGIKVLISVGGATLSSHFSAIALTADSRQKFVTSCINLFLKGNLPVSNGAGGPAVGKGVFDGIDIDWEFPVTGPGGQAADRHNATLLFREFRRQLKAYGDSIGKHFLLTAAIPPGNEANARYEIAAVSESLDWMNLMVYDLHGGWETETDFDSPFKLDPADPNGSYQFTFVGTAQILIHAGVPASKIVMGVPFYAYKYTSVNNADNGLYQTRSGDVTSDTTYRNLVDDQHIVTAGANPVGQNGYTRFTRPQAGGEPWLWNPNDAGGTFITYEDAAAIQKRVQYVWDNGLRGLMAWEISQDDAGHHLSDALGVMLP